MKTRELMLVLLIAAACTSAIRSDAQTQQAVGPSEIAAQSQSGVNSPPPNVPKPIKKGRNQELRGHFQNIRGGVVNEMKATSAFVQREVANTGALDNWLMVLAGFGLIVLQLRRKHKSLPQRRITPYG